MVLDLLGDLRCPVRRRCRRAGRRWAGTRASVTFGVAVVLVGLAGVIGWQLASTAVDVTLDADGTVVLRRQRGVVRTHVVRVRRLRRSALRSSFTPTVIETADGWAYLIHRPERDDLVAALRRPWTWWSNSEMPRRAAGRVHAGAEYRSRPGGAVRCCASRSSASR
ncbi:hypothetical protein HBB16_04640 [Pseudonocardia sp. MCCB 268]|nr:hypothetical protein [Pseudonocardia cytotoxica]